MLIPLFKKIGVIFSLNDPQWGRGSKNDNQNKNPDGKKPEGPPDLEQLFSDLSDRLKNFINGKKGGGGDSGGGGFTPNMKGAGIGAGAIAGIVLFLWGISGFFSVTEGQTAIVMTFGKYDKDAVPPTTSGFKWRWPYPIQSHEIVNVSQVRTIEVGYRTDIKNKQPKEALMLTDDENIIDIQFTVQYKLNDAADWIFSNRDPEEAVRQVAETSVREVVGKSKMDFVLYEGRSKVAFEVSKSMQQILDRYKSGVLITSVTMQGVQPPEQVQAAFDDAVKAGQDRERQKNEGQAYANDVIPRASGAAARLKQEAEAYRASVTANAEGDASRFKQVLTEYAKAPAVTRDRMYLETMQQIFSSTTKVLMDAKGGNNLLYLPLDKLIAQTVANEAAGVKPSAVAPAATINSLPDPLQALGQKDNRSRDSRESRDRESR